MTQQTTQSAAAKVREGLVAAKNRLELDEERLKELVANVDAVECEVALWRDVVAAYEYLVENMVVEPEIPPGHDPVFGADPTAMIVKSGDRAGKMQKQALVLWGFQELYRLRPGAWSEGREADAVVYEKLGEIVNASSRASVCKMWMDRGLLEKHPDGGGRFRAIPTGWQKTLEEV